MKRTRWTTELVLAWIAEHRPDFEVEAGWTYENVETPIPGRCLVEDCGAECAPRLNDLKKMERGYCYACGRRASVAERREHAEAEIRRVAAERGYEVVDVFMKERSHGKRGMEKNTHAILRCSCGNEWGVQQGHLCSRGSGCGNCAEFGFNPLNPGAIYLLARSVDGVEQRGFGISNDWPTRTVGYERFGWLAIDVVEFENGQDARDFETVINREVAAVAGRSVEPDSVYYKNKEAFADGHGVPMFRDVRSLISWAVASTGLRERSVA